jgi:hypothetical protein
MLKRAMARSSGKGADAPASMALAGRERDARRERGDEGDRRHQATGRSRGRRTATIHALCDEQCRPHAILRTGGNVADITAAATLVSAIARPGELAGDKSCDANHLRRFLAAVCLVPAITCWA